jgi:RNA polymerase sigma-70 factor (ECF subfamily)
LNAKDTDAPRANEALEALCRTYYYPLYAFVRRQGHDVHAAQDLTQGFFHRFVAKDYLSSVAPEKGRFRSFLLASLKHFLSHARERESAIKRGGGQKFVSLDGLEERYSQEPLAVLAAEVAYDRGWATTLMERALDNLSREFETEGKADQFERLQRFLAREPAAGEYAAIGGAANMAPGAVSVAVHRLRQRYGEAVRAEVANTVAHPAEVDEELRHLFAVLTAG